MKKLVLYAAFFTVICFGSCKKTTDKDYDETDQTSQESEPADQTDHGSSDISITFKDKQSVHFHDYNSNVKFCVKRGYKYYYSSSNCEKNPKYDVIVGWSGNNTRKFYKQIVRDIQNTRHYAKYQVEISDGEKLPSGGTNLQLLHDEVSSYSSILPPRDIK